MAVAPALSGGGGTWGRGGGQFQKVLTYGNEPFLFDLGMEHTALVYGHTDSCVSEAS